MNLNDTRYNSFALVKEMLETADIIAGFDFAQTKKIADAVQKTGKVFLTGEGSSRIFPAKNFITAARKANLDIVAVTEGASQATEYNLSGWTVIAASNSGQTAEVIPLLKGLKEQGHPHTFAVSANPDAKIFEYSTGNIVLKCGKEQAVAATKSVVEQALVYQSLLTAGLHSPLADAGSLAKQVLNAEYESGIIDKLANADHIYFAGRNDGVAEELALKTIEITRKKSAYFEGTYLLHGVEEMFGSNDAIVLIDPFEDHMQRIKERYADNLHIPVVAIRAADVSPLFPTIAIPHLPCYDGMFQLLAGWNLLVQIGVANNINIDKPLRARKIGNEFKG